MVTERIGIVVGAGGTIGGACARALAPKRDSVLCVDLDHGRASQTAEAIHAAGGRAHVVEADAAATDFSAVVSSAVPDDATVTAVVHAVAYEEHVASMDASRDSMLRSFAAGPLAAFTLFRDLLVAGHLDRGSALTAIGSLHATHPFARCIAYNAGHGALAQVVRTLAHEWAERGIRVNAVVPGWIRTDAEVKFYGDEFLNRIASTLPFGRFGAAEDVAAAVEFLSSEKAAYISGSFLSVDGALSVSLARLTDGSDT